MKGAMVRCLSCGFHVEREDANGIDQVDPEVTGTCASCTKCQVTPDLRVAYSRGFNAGLDAMKAHMSEAAEASFKLRKPSAR
jgi:hypothetical protein